MLSSNPRTNVDVTSNSPSVAYAAYILSVALLAISCFLPHQRLWGLNFFPYLPPWYAVSAIALLSFAPFAAMRISQRGESHPADANLFARVTIALALVSGVMFYFFRARTFFFGDGYQILSVLSANQPFLKPTEYGTALIHLGLFKLLGGVESVTVISYQAVSILVGIMFVLLSGYLARLLFTSFFDRVLLLLGLLSAGYTLTFFGYVENYGPLILCTLGFIVIGIRITKGQSRRWLILLPLIFGVFFHVLAITLLLPTLFVLLSGSAMEQRYRRISRQRRRMIWAGVFAVLGFVSFQFLSESLFLRLALLSPIPHDLTVPGYSLFSPAHLADYLNLIWLLCPGIGVLLAVMARLGMIASFKERPTRFLAWTTASCLAVAFVLDPKLGMPRDWDLFAYAGVPLVVFAVALSLKSDRKITRVAMILAIAMSGVVLSSRIAIGMSPESTLNYVEYIRDLDPVKTRNLWFVLIKYHRDLGDGATALQIQEEWNRRFPELSMNREAFDSFQRGQYLETIKICRAMIQINPSYSEAWSKAGMAFQALHQTDSALRYLEIANALSPFSSPNYINLATVLIDRGSLDRAESLLQETLDADSSFAALYYQYSRIYKQRGDQNRHIEYLRKACLKKDALPGHARELTLALLQIGRVSQAREALEFAIRLGLDSAAVDALVKAHPELSP